MTRGRSTPSEHVLDSGLVEKMSSSEEQLDTFEFCRLWLAEGCLGSGGRELALSGRLLIVRVVVVAGVGCRGAGRGGGCCTLGCSGCCCCCGGDGRGNCCGCC
ncbi:hypothetical protein NP493_201g03019 [Ridgeia piscesae]|uniref:Uncharacterized protein n=1 Tax=Ridgeia piscesae TaxID=27915 RepID=A0AAD9P1J5_RIDPI|nr:hypothetical protein NP493_201g03019 [Ridgeia piscesae]